MSDTEDGQALPVPNHEENTEDLRALIGSYVTNLPELTRRSKLMIEESGIKPDSPEMEDDLVNVVLTMTLFRSIFEGLDNL